MGKSQIIKKTIKRWEEALSNTRSKECEGYTDECIQGVMEGLILEFLDDLKDIKKEK